jgi:hypothetical protein
MNKKSILFLGILALSLITFSLAAAQKPAVIPARKVIPLPPDKIVPLKPPVVTGEKDYCLLSHTNWTTFSFASVWNVGDKIAVYFDPEDCGNPQNYPFQLTGVKFYLYDRLSVGEVDVRFSVEIVCPDICDGPEIEIWKSQVYKITTLIL